MTQLTIILFLVVVGFVALFIWNAANFSTLKSQSKVKDIQLNDAKYWELKYKFEFLVAMVGIITAVVGLLGYNSLKSIEDSVKADLNSKVDSLQNTLDITVRDVNTKLAYAADSVQILSSNVRGYQATMNHSTINLGLLDKQQSKLRLMGLESQSNLKALSDQIDTINSKNKIKRPEYIIPDIPLKYTENDYEVTLKYRDLVTNNGDKLPTFTKPPFITTTSLKDVEFRITSATTEEFKVQLQLYSATINLSTTTFYVTLMIRESN